MENQDQLDNQKSELLQDIMAVEKIMEELWKYHPENPKSISLVLEYQKLGEMKENILSYLDYLY